MNKKIIEKIIKFRDDRNWKQYHSGENLAKALSIEAAELLELYQWKHEVDNLEALKEELADVLIYGILLADTYNFDIEEIIEDKLKKNNEKYPVEKSYGNAKKYNEF
ncbi:MAG TPA: nucleotide pyrophosphohydrolase [Acholeplasmataceae bacterium]|nr:nucleotide pyrophosphohydrolase [Acholeplasmataceae bacterium]